VTVTATESTEKTKAFDEALKGKPALLRSTMLDPLNDVFVASVQSHLPDIDPEALHGRLYVGQAAVDAGLAHKLGSLQDAIQLAFDLAEEAPTAATDGGTSTASSFSPTPNSTSQTPNQPTMGLFSSKTSALAAVLALSGKTGLNAEATKAANEELAAAGITDAAIITQAEYTDLSTKAGRTDAAEAKATGLQASVDKLTTDLAASQAEAARLGALGGATPTSSVKPAGDTQDAPKAHAWFDANAQHNKDAEALLS
jgi:ClpP class serine protease